MTTPDAAALAERFTLRALVEACLVIEEGVAALKDVDVGMTAGAGISPPPLRRADEVGLDLLLERLERAEREWGDRFTPPLLLRRLVAQGRLGVRSGQGFYPYPQPDEGWGEGPVKLERRDRVAIAWLDKPPANSLSPEMAGELRRLWDEVSGDGATRALVIASANPALFCAGADIKAFASMDPAAAGELAGSMHALLSELEHSEIVTLAAVNGLALGGGCELTMACDLRLAADSASFGQPEIDLGIIPGFGGTQRLPRLVGEARALEMNLTGQAVGADEAYELGLVNRLIPDHELFDVTLGLARGLASKAPRAVGTIKRLTALGDRDAGLAAEARAFAEVFASEDAREGVAAFLAKRSARFTGR
jgi:enoyl-CoA hydratase/3-hydroxyacyl-CoA dehydrogenase